MKRITLRGRVFRLVDGGKEIAKNTEAHMDVVVVSGSKSVQKSYYAAEYNAEETSIPDCWSSDGERPDADVENPQASICKDCPQAIKGAGGPGRAACRYSWRLGVVLRNNVGGDIFQLILPQKSIFGTGDVDHMPFLQYAKYVAGSGYNLNMLATRLTFDTDSDFPKLVFSNSEFLDKPTYQIALAQGQTQVAVNAGKMNFTKKSETPAIPKLVAPAGSAAAEAKEEEAAPEPTVRVDKKKAVVEPKPKQNLAAMVDDWGDDDK
jgi:ribosomal protein L13